MADSSKQPYRQNTKWYNLFLLVGQFSCLFHGMKFKKIF